MRTASATSKSKSTTSTRSPNYVYVYCAVRGVPPSRSLSKLPAMPGGAKPRALPLSEGRLKPAVSLIVSDVPAEMYSTEAIESRLSDLDWVAQCGTAHHAVADEIVQKHTVIPFRLFTLFSSDATAISALGRRARAIDAALKRVNGKGEWLLKITKSAEGAKGAGGAEGAMTGTSFLQQKAAAKQAAAETARRVREDAAAAFETLAGMAAESTSRDVSAGTLLLDASFLVAARRLPAFKRALTAAAKGLLESGCRVSLTGPWPPYSFVALEEHARG